MKIKKKVLIQKTAAEAYIALFPKTDAKLVYATVEGIEENTVQGCLSALNEQIKDITGGGVVTGVKGDAENEYHQGNVSISKANIGLEYVDNTADADKPISTKTQEALNDKQDKLTFDSTPTEESENPVTSSGIYEAIKGFVDETDLEENYYTKDAIDRIIVGIQNLKYEIVTELPPVEEAQDMTFYFVPCDKADSNHIYDIYFFSKTKGEYELVGEQSFEIVGYVTTKELNEAIEGFITETAIKELIKDSLDDYQKALTFDATPTEGSENPVTSGGIKTAIDTATDSKIDKPQEAVGDATHTLQVSEDGEFSVSDTELATKEDLDTLDKQVNGEDGEGGLKKEVENISDKFSELGEPYSGSAFNVSEDGIITGVANITESWESKDDYENENLAEGGFALVDDDLFEELFGELGGLDDDDKN